MKKKTVVLILSIILSMTLIACGEQGEVVSTESNQNETSVQNEENAGNVGSNLDDSNNVVDNGNMVIYNDKQDSSEEIDISSIIDLPTPVELHFIKDTNFYDESGKVSGYIKADSYVTFSKYSDKWSGFENNGEIMYAKLDELEKNAVNENLVEETQEVSEQVAENSQERSILYYLDEPDVGEYDIPIDTSSFKDIEGSIIVMFPLSFHNENGNRIGNIMKVGAELQLLKENENYILLEVEDTELYVSKKQIADNTYNPATEALLTDEDFMNKIQEMKTKFEQIEVVDSKDELDFNYKSSTFRKEEQINEAADAAIREPLLDGFSKVYIEIVESDEYTITFNVYSK